MNELFELILKKLISLDLNARFQPSPLGLKISLEKSEIFPDISAIKIGIVEYLSELGIESTEEIPNTDDSCSIKWNSGEFLQIISIIYDIRKKQFNITSIFP